MSKSFTVNKNGVSFHSTLTVRDDDNGESHLCLETTTVNKNLFGYKIVCVTGIATQQGGTAQKVDTDIFKIYGKIPAFLSSRKKNRISKSVKKQFEYHTDEKSISENENVNLLDSQIRKKAAELADLKILLEGEDLSADPDYTRVATELDNLKIERRNLLDYLTKQSRVNGIEYDCIFIVR